MIKYTNWTRSNSNFRTRMSGDWDNYFTWEIQNADGTWEVCPFYPQGGNLVTVRDTHTVTLTQNETAKLITLESSGFVDNGIYNIVLTGLDSDTQTYLNELSGVPDWQIQQAYNDLILGCKADTSLSTGSNWDRLDRFNVLMSHSREAAYTSLKNPASDKYVDIVAPYFFPFQGSQGDGATMYYNMNFNPSTDGVNYLQNDASVFIYSKTNASNSSSSVGATNASNQGVNMVMRTTTDNIQGALNGGLNNIGSAGSQTTSAMMLGFRRINGTQIITVRNGVDTNTSSQTSVAPVNLDWFGHCRNANGVPSNFDAKLISARGCGSGYIDQAKMKTRIDSFETSVLSYLNAKVSLSDYIFNIGGQSNALGSGLLAEYSSEYTAVIPNTKIWFSGSMQNLQIGVNNKLNPANNKGGYELTLGYNLQLLTSKEIFIAKTAYGGTQIYKEADTSSVTSMTIGTGGKTFTTAVGRTWASGSRIRVTNGVNYMEGNASAYDSGTGVITVGFDTAVGSGTFASWTVQLVTWDSESRGQFCDLWLTDTYSVIDYCVANNKNFKMLDLWVHGEEDGLDTTKANAYSVNVQKFYKYRHSKIHEYINSNYPSICLPPIRIAVQETPSNAGANGDTVRAAEAALVTTYGSRGLLITKTGLSNGEGTLDPDNVHLNANGFTTKTLEFDTLIATLCGD